MMTSIYLHADKHTMWEKGEELGLKGDALSLFRHACTEVQIGLYVNMETGAVKIVSVDGRVLA